jgi:hypothetical protein
LFRVSGRICGDGSDDINDDDIIITTYQTGFPFYHYLIYRQQRNDDGITTYQQYADSQFRYLIPNDDANSQNDAEFDDVHAKCIAISEATGCLVSAVRPQSGKGDGKNGAGGSGNGNGNDGDEKAVRRGWQFQLSGGNVMDARRRVMDQFRPDVSSTFY